MNDIEGHEQESGLPDILVVRSKNRIEKIRDEVILATVQECGQMISGHCYAAVMGHLAFAEYQWCLDSLTRSGKIRIENHVIFAVK